MRWQSKKAAREGFLLPVQSTNFGPIFPRSLNDKRAYVITASYEPLEALLTFLVTHTFLTKNPAVHNKVRAYDITKSSFSLGSDRSNIIPLYCDGLRSACLGGYGSEHMQVGKVTIEMTNRFLRSIIHQKAGEFRDNGHPTIFCWISSHSGLIGNEKADLAAKNRAEKGGRLTERWSSLAYIRRNVTEMPSKDIAKWHET